ncbi:ATP-binding cassette domain-containing protein [Roseinatronobacter sp. S2]|nr:oligopeptide/dipeptide ABC transporter ATP-binding protein [Roseinatronobacter sp. S2]WFE74769.1 ATP-binding cassette domain-containing protein [Roseinatronobacter sp. S2]
MADNTLTSTLTEGVRKAGRRKGDPLLEIRNLQMHFPVTKGFLHRVVGTVRAVDNLSITIRAGETVGLVGESGCGKTTAGRCIVRAYKPTGGQLVYHRHNGETIDLSTLSNRELKPFRRDIRMIFQDPHSSLNPRWTVRDIVSEPLAETGKYKKPEIEDRVIDLLRKVGLRPEYLSRHPHAFSGGERQRIGIARALALNPELVVCDEAVSALDVSVQAQTINLLQDLQEELGLTYLFVAHDLSVVEHISTRVAVMYVGNIVELATTEDLYRTPLHPYTEALLAAVPKADPRLRGKGATVRLAGEVADPANKPSGCHFHPRCPYATDQCKTEVPDFRETRKNHFVACHRADELNLRGAY